MLKILGMLIKLTIFSVIVLALGNSLHWDGKTISDQVKTHMAHAETWVTKKTANMKNEEIPASEKQKLRALIRELNSASQ